jgi:hypothetical protein
MANFENSLPASDSPFTTNATEDARKLTYDEITKLADHLYSRGVTTTPPFSDLREHQSELRLASAALRLLASHKAGFARIAHGAATAKLPVEELNDLFSRRLDHFVSTILSFPLREVAHDIALASRAVDDLRSLRQDIAAAADWIGR